MARAQAGAQNQAAFQAMGQAQGEMMNQGQLASQFGQLGNQMGQQGLAQYQASFLPMQQQMNAMQIGQNNMNMAQSGQFTGAGYGAQLGLGGIQTQVNADKAASELYGNVLGHMMTNANQEGGGMFSSLFGGS